MILKSKTLKKLKICDVSFLTLHDAQILVKAIANSEFMPLKELTIRNSIFKKEILGALIEAINKYPRLEHVDLSRNYDRQLFIDNKHIDLDSKRLLGYGTQKGHRKRKEKEKKKVLRKTKEKWLKELKKSAMEYAWYAYQGIQDYG